MKTFQYTGMPKVYFGKPSETNVSDEINEAVMRNVIRNIRAVIKDPKDLYVRSELMWDSSMAENGILKLGKQTDFQNHMIEHQLGAYTDCNHGQGLAVIHPAVYRHLYKDNLKKFVRFAEEVWHVDTNGRTDGEIALAGIDALAAFIREIGLPTTLTELKSGLKLRLLLQSRQVMHISRPLPDIKPAEACFPSQYVSSSAVLPAVILLSRYFQFCRYASCSFCCN